MFCALASHYRVPPFPNLIPRRNDFSFLKDNSCSKWSSRCSRVSQNEICRSEQEAFIVFFDVPSCQPFFGWKSHFAILTECLAGVRPEESCSPPPQGSSEGSGWAGMFVFKPETPWPFIYGHWGVNLNLVLEWTQLSQQNCLCVCVHLSTTAEFGKPTVSDEKLLPGDPGGTESRMGERGETQPGQDAGSLSRRNNKPDFWPVEPSHIPLPITIPWRKYPLFNASKKKIWVSVQDYLLFCSIFKQGESKVVTSSNNSGAVTKRHGGSIPFPSRARRHLPQRCDSHPSRLKFHLP